MDRGSSAGEHRREGSPGSDVMTIGELSRRTGVSVKALRRYEGLGLIYTAGRSPANYRLFDQSALWCVGVISGLRNLGLTVAEIRTLACVYLDRPSEPIGPHLAERLEAARARLDARIAELEGLRRRIDEFVVTHRDRLSGPPEADFRNDDPRNRLGCLDSPPGGRPYGQPRG